MSLTLKELKYKLSQTLDEISFLEILRINMDDLVEAFEGRILERFDELEEELDFFEGRDRIDNEERDELDEIHFSDD